MKSPGIAAFFLVASLATTAIGQTKSVAANKQPTSKPGAAGAPGGSSQTPPNATRVRVLGDPKAGAATANVTGAEKLQAHARSDFNNHPETSASRGANGSSVPTSNKPLVSSSTSVSTSNSLRPALEGANRTSRLHTSFKPAAVSKVNGTSAPAANPPARVAAPPVTTAPPVAMAAVAASQVYRVGVRDVLDIQLSDTRDRSSTLFTVLEGGVLEYPFAGGPIPVAGLTTTEIATLLRQRIKIFDNPAVTVSVRDYASHAVTVNGFVAAPGTKTLRREAVPLYAILAEALVLPEAARATITRSGRTPIIVDLKDANLSATLVVPGDAIKVLGVPAGPTEFFFIGGEINSPGQKAYSAGLTLTQAILASGGTSAGAGSKVRVSRQGADRLLVTEEYNLRKILNGKLPDPLLQKGDRIEVTTSN